jgi:hypothetical protein
MATTSPDLCLGDEFPGAPRRLSLNVAFWRFLGGPRHRSPAAYMSSGPHPVTVGHLLARSVLRRGKFRSVTTYNRQNHCGHPTIAPNSLARILSNLPIIYGVSRISLTGLFRFRRIFRWNSLSRIEMNYFPKFFLGAIFCTAIIATYRGVSGRSSGFDSSSAPTRRARRPRD